MNAEQQKMWAALAQSPDWILDQLSSCGVNRRRLERSIERHQSYHNSTWRTALTDSLDVISGYEGLTEAAQDFCSDNNIYSLSQSTNWVNYK